MTTNVEDLCFSEASGLLKSALDKGASSSDLERRLPSPVTGVLSTALSCTDQVTRQIL